MHGSTIKEIFVWFGFSATDASSSTTINYALIVHNNQGSSDVFLPPTNYRQGEG
jgi:hypothetical protein